MSLESIVIFLNSSSTSITLSLDILDDNNDFFVLISLSFIFFNPAIVFIEFNCCSDKLIISLQFGQLIKLLDLFNCNIFCFLLLNTLIDGLICIKPDINVSRVSCVNADK